MRWAPELPSRPGVDEPAAHPGRNQRSVLVLSTPSPRCLLRLRIQPGALDPGEEDAELVGVGAAGPARVAGVGDAAGLSAGGCVNATPAPWIASGRISPPLGIGGRMAIRRVTSASLWERRDGRRCEAL